MAGVAGKAKWTGERDGKHLDRSGGGTNASRGKEGVYDACRGGLWREEAISDGRAHDGSMAQSEITSFLYESDDADVRDDDSNSPSITRNVCNSDDRSGFPCFEPSYQRNVFAGVAAVGSGHGTSDISGAPLPGEATNYSIQHRRMACDGRTKGRDPDEGNQTGGPEGSASVRAPVEGESRRDANEGHESTSKNTPHHGRRRTDRPASVMTISVTRDYRLEGCSSRSVSPFDSSKSVVENVVTFGTDIKPAEDSEDLDGMGAKLLSTCGNGGGWLAKEQDRERCKHNCTRHSGETKGFTVGGAHPADKNNSHPEVSERNSVLPNLLTIPDHSQVFVSRPQQKINSSMAGIRSELLLASVSGGLC